MHLAQIGPGRYRAKLSVGLDPNTGRYRQRSKVFRARTKTQARRMAEAWAAELRPDPEGVTVAQLLEAFLADSDLSPSTVRAYRSRIDHHIVPHLGRVRASELDRRRLNAWRRQLAAADIKPRTANGCIAVLKAAVRWADRAGYPVDVGALSALRALRVDDNGLEAPDPADVVAVLSDAVLTDPTFGLMLWLTAVTGCRRGELAGLRWSDFIGDTLRIARSVDQSGAVGTTKTRQQRTVMLDPGTVALLEQHKRDEQARWRADAGDDEPWPADGWLFPSPLDWTRPRSVDSITHQLAKLRGGRRVWLHGLRHGVATILIAAGVNPRTVSDRLGHSRTSMTLDVYTSPASEQDRAAAELIASRLRELMTGGTPSGDDPSR